MALFDQILSALQNPNQQASPDQLSGIVQGVQQVALRYGINPATTQSVLSALGKSVRTALQEQRASTSADHVETIVNQFSGTSPDIQAVEAVFTPQQQQQVSQNLTQQTGLNSATIQSLLVSLTPVVLNLLKSGAATAPSAPLSPTSAPTGSRPSGIPPSGSNAVLNAFLDTDGDGDVDVADAFSLASRFLAHPR